MGWCSGPQARSPLLCPSEVAGRPPFCRRDCLSRQAWIEKQVTPDPRFLACLEGEGRQLPEKRKFPGRQRSNVPLPPLVTDGSCNCVSLMAMSCVLEGLAAQCVEGREGSSVERSLMLQGLALGVHAALLLLQPAGSGICCQLQRAVWSTDPGWGPGSQTWLQRWLPGSRRRPGPLRLSNPVPSTHQPPQARGGRFVVLLYVGDGLSLAASPRPHSFDLRASEVPPTSVGTPPPPSESRRVGLKGEAQASPGLGNGKAWPC